MDSPRSSAGTKTVEIAGKKSGLFDVHEARLFGLASCRSRIANRSYAPDIPASQRRPSSVLEASVPHTPSPARSPTPARNPEQSICANPPRNRHHHQTTRNDGSGRNAPGAAQRRTCRHNAVAYRPPTLVHVHGDDGSRSSLSRSG